LQNQYFSFTFTLHQEPERVPTGQPKPRWQNDAGILAVGSQMRFALALRRVMKSRFPVELDGQKPALPLNLKTTLQLVNGELKASAILR
jgi:hypothetical protein